MSQNRFPIIKYRSDDILGEACFQFISPSVLSRYDDPVLTVSLDENGVVKSFSLKEKRKVSILDSYIPLTK